MHWRLPWCTSSSLMIGRPATSRAGDRTAAGMSFRALLPDLPGSLNAIREAPPAAGVPSRLALRESCRLLTGHGIHSSICVERRKETPIGEGATSSIRRKSTVRRMECAAILLPIQKKKKRHFNLLETCTMLPTPHAPQKSYLA
ncbi:hypothetical protein BS78_07G175800 [Paspalum vaginatum]|nr:hypothetical protein BS78_07G175800 [Paspalum vaginatum]